MRCRLFKTLLAVGWNTSSSSVMLSGKSGACGDDGGQLILACINYTKNKITNVCTFLLKITLLNIYNFNKYHIPIIAM